MDYRKTTTHEVWHTISKRSYMYATGGDPKSRNDGGKMTQILKDGIAERRNGGKFSEFLKDKYLTLVTRILHFTRWNNRKSPS